MLISVKPHIFRTKVTINVPPLQLQSSILVFIFKNDRDNAKAADTRGEKAKKYVSSSDKPEGKSVHSPVTVLLTWLSIQIQLIIWVKIRLVNSVYPDTT